MNAQILFPNVSEAEIEALTQDIAEHGIAPPITFWRGQIVGVPRLVACLHLGIVPQFEFPEDDGPPTNFDPDSRLSLTTAQIAIAAASLSMRSEYGGTRTPEAERRFPTIAQAAALFGISAGTVQEARKVLQYGDQDLIRRCMLPLTASKSERLAISKAAEIVDAKIKQARALKRREDSIEAQVKDAFRTMLSILPLSTLDDDITNDQRAMIAARFSLAGDPGAGHVPTAEDVNIPTVSQASDMFKIDETTIEYARKVLSTEDDELVRRCMLPSNYPDQLPVSEAARIAEDRRQDRPAG